MTSTVIATRGQRLALARARITAGDPQTRGVPHGVARRRRDRHRRSDRGGRRVRRRRHRRAPSRSSTLDTSPARQPSTRTRGQSSRRPTPRSTGANCPRRRRTCSTIDHRVTASRRATRPRYIRATWDVTPDIRIHIETVHRLSDRGAVVTHASHGTSQEGFDAEWRIVDLVTSRRRGDQPRRAVRRGRPRRRARAVRRAQSSGAAAGERGKPSGRSLRRVLRSAATGTPWRSY